MERADIALAERGGVQVATGVGAVPQAGATDFGPAAGDTSALAPPRDPGSAPTVGGSGVPGAATPSGGSSAGRSSSAVPRSATASAPAPGAAAPTAASASPPVGASAPAPGQQQSQGQAPVPAPVPGQPAPAAPGRGSEVAVGTVATLSGPVGAFVKDTIVGLNVWAKSVNSRGGVAGHPVRYVVADDGGDPARYNALVRQLHEEQKVVAFLFNTIGFAGGDQSYVEDKKVPLVGHEGGTEIGYESPMVFTPWPAGLSYAYSLLAGLADVTIPAGKVKLGSIACSDVKLCDLFDATWTGPAAKELGFEVVYRARASLTQPDFTAECLSAQRAGAEVIIAAVDNNSYLRLERSCARQSYDPVLGIADQLALPSVAADPVMEGDVVSTRVAPWPDTSVPGIAELHGAFAKFAPGVEVNGSHPAAWILGKIFELAGKSFPAEPTKDDVLAGLYAIDGDTIGGMTYPVRFPKDGPEERKSCWSSVVIKNQRFTVPEGFKLKCK